MSLLTLKEVGAELDALTQRWFATAEAQRARGDLSGADEREQCANELADLVESLDRKNEGSPRVMTPARVVSCERKPPGWVVTLSCGCVYANLVAAVDPGTVTHHACDAGKG